MSKFEIILGGPGLIRWRPLSKERLSSGPCRGNHEPAGNEFRASSLMRRQPGPHSGYSPGRLGAMGPVKLSGRLMHRNWEKRNADYKVCGGLQETSTTTTTQGSPS